MKGGRMRLIRFAMMIAVIGFASIASAQVNSNVHLKPFRAGQPKESKARIEVREQLGAEGCAGFANGSSCTTMCLYQVKPDDRGVKRSSKIKCMKANHVNSQERRNQLMDRAGKLEKRMNEPGFSYSQEELGDDFYRYANRHVQSYSDPSKISAYGHDSSTGAPVD